MTLHRDGGRIMELEPVLRKRVTVPGETVIATYDLERYCRELRAGKAVDIDKLGKAMTQVYGHADAERIKHEREVQGGD